MATKSFTLKYCECNVKHEKKGITKSPRIVTRSSAIADKLREPLFCKVVEVLQDFLSENVDKKFTTSDIPFLKIISVLVSISLS